MNLPPYDIVTVLGEMHQKFMVVQYLHNPQHGMDRVKTLAIEYGQIDNLGGAVGNFIVGIEHSDMKWRLISLDKWREHWGRGIDLFSGLLNFREELSEIKIWENGRGESYWQIILRMLCAWNYNVNSVQLSEATWRLYPDHIEVTIPGWSETSISRVIERQGAGWELWVLRVAEGFAGFSTELLDMQLLTAQLAAQRGGGALSVETAGRRFFLRLTLPRADVVPPPSRAPGSLPDDVAGALVHHIAWTLIERAIEIVEELVNLLDEEIAHYEQTGKDLPPEEKERRPPLWFLNTVRKNLAPRISPFKTCWEATKREISPESWVAEINGK